jgi:Rrf2 family protein
MKLSTQADYAVRTVYELSRRQPGAIVQTREIAEAQGLPEQYLAKVVQSLARAGLLHTSRGNHGGVSLTRPPVEISVREVFEAVDGPLELHRCGQRPEPCGAVPCGTHDFWERVERLLAGELESMDFKALVAGGATTGGTVTAGTSTGR